MQKEEILQKYYGYTTFRNKQSEIIDAIIDKKQALVIMPTGGGKSLCYQIPALLLPGVTVVISPLISLMKDQVDDLTSRGIPAAFINSSLYYEEVLRIMAGIKAGDFKLIYVAPERFESAEFMRYMAEVTVSLVAVDEAHCISQWGHEFRPSYLRIKRFIDAVKAPRVAAFTATATEKVRIDIQNQLAFADCETFITGFDRQNLHFAVKQLKDKEKLDYIRAYLEGQSGKSGIIYAGTRKNVEMIYIKLQEWGLQAGFYHAGMSDAQRKKSQNDFIYDRIDIMVATNAFGMGIDKPNVRFVIHYNLPGSMEHYYQEAGRSGRDGDQAECILLFSKKDIELRQFFIGTTFPDIKIINETYYIIGAEKSIRIEALYQELDIYRSIEIDSAIRILVENGLIKNTGGIYRVLNPDQTFRLDIKRYHQSKNESYRKLQLMAQYGSTTNCLRKYILAYFGEDMQKDNCHNCSNCGTIYQEKDMTVLAQKVLSCVYRLKQRFGITEVKQVLRGSKNPKILELGFNRLSTYGIAAAHSEDEIEAVVHMLVSDGYLRLAGDPYPILKLTAKSGQVLVQGEKVFLRVKQEKIIKREEKYDKKLFEKLRKVRTELSETEDIPSYCILQDSVLREMSIKKPVTAIEMMGIKGIGETKLRRYGDIFLQAINAGS